jgi:hypothetical protein
VTAKVSKKVKTTAKATKPRTKNAWDRPDPMPGKGNKGPEAVYAAVGEALSIWETVEEHLAHIFSVLIGLRRPSTAAVRAYGSLTTFRGKSEMIAAAAEVYFHDHPDEGLQQKFNDALKAAIGFSARRNEIAHGIVQQLKKAPNQSLGFFLRPPFYNSSKVKWGFGPIYRYDSKTIKAFQDGFVQTVIELNQIFWMISYKALPKSSRTNLSARHSKKPSTPKGSGRRKGVVRLNQ